MILIKILMSFKRIKRELNIFLSHPLSKDFILDYYYEDYYNKFILCCNNSSSFGWILMKLSLLLHFLI